MIRLVKIFTGILAVYYLWTQKNLASVFSGLDISWDMLVLVLVLTSLNWYWEIKKWQYLVSQVKKIDFLTATYQSLTGFAVSMLTPNRVGEYGAKVLFFEPALRRKIFSLSLIGNFSQLGATVLFGLAGIFWVWHKKLLDFNLLDGSSGYAWLWGILFLLLLFIIYKKYLHKPSLLLTDRRIWTGSFRYAIFRYLAFATEFYLLYQTLNINVSDIGVLFSAIFIMYFLSAFVPMLAFLDWAVKGSIAVWVFAQLGLNDVLALKVTTLMWFFNFFVPFVAGWLIYIFKSHKKHPKL